jgi:TRAP transporter TAXI family solute receptor
MFRDTLRCRCWGAIRWLAAAVVLCSGCAESREGERIEPPIETVRLTTGAPGGGFDHLGQALDTFSRNLPSLRVLPVPSGGAVSNLRAVQAGDADIGFTFADVAYLAYIGRLDNSSSFDQLRAIAVLQVTPVQLAVRRDSGIKTVGDLRGRRVALGPDGSGTALTSRLILRAYGLSDEEVEGELLEFADAAQSLVDGTLEAMFDNAVYADSVRRVVESGGQLVPIQGPHVDRLRTEYPFFHKAVIPRDTYSGLPAVPTIGVDSLLICRRTLDPRIVYAFAEALFGALPALLATQGMSLQLDRAPSAPIPLHDGAARYYREQELLR